MAIYNYGLKVIQLIGKVPYIKMVSKDFNKPRLRLSAEAPAHGTRAPQAPAAENGGLFSSGPAAT